MFKKTADLVAVGTPNDHDHHLSLIKVWTTFTGLMGCLANSTAICLFLKSRKVDDDDCVVDEYDEDYVDDDDDD